MRRIVVSEFVSIDGVMEGPGPQDPYEHAGWTMAYQDPARMQYKLQEVRDHDALLLGRVTYDGFAAAWPNITDEAGFAEKMNAMPKFVVSRTLTDPSWHNTTVISEQVPERIAELKAGEGGDILVAGSSRLLATLIEHDLVDELRLMTFPLLLGAGQRLLAAGVKTELALADVQRYDSGVVTLTYRRERD